MSGLQPLALVATGASAVCIAALVVVLVRPPRRLAGRIRPYSVAARTSLGRAPDVPVVADAEPALGAGTLRRLLGPLVAAATRRLSAVIDAGADRELARRIRQSRLLMDIPAERRVHEYRTRQVGATLAGAAGGAAGGLLLQLAAAAVLALALLGGVAGGARWRGRLDRAVEARRERMRIELYTVNQLLAMHVRVGGGVVQALQHVVARGEGELVSELTEVLRAHESGVPARDALHHAAASTPEPFVARTYRLLGTGAELGADLADALLAHSDDVREARRDALRRAAVARRAAMLVPIIGVLAPVMLLFVAAPLPTLVLGGP